RAPTPRGPRTAPAGCRALWRSQLRPRRWSGSTARDPRPGTPPPGLRPRGQPAAGTHAAAAPQRPASPAPAAPGSSGRTRWGRCRDRPASLPVMTVLAYGADMASTLGAPPDRSQSGFTADLLEALTGCAELINTGRSAAGDGLRDVADVQSLGDRYAFHGVGAGPRDLPRLRAHLTQ